MEQLYKTIYELETSLLKPEIRSSYDELNKLLAQDFTEFGSSGLVYTKQNILERLPSNTNKIVFVVSDFQIKNLSYDVVMANFKTDAIINNIDNVSSLRTSFWRNENGSWRMFFHQGTKVKKEEQKIVLQNQDQAYEYFLLFSNLATNLIRRKECFSQLEKRLIGKRINIQNLFLDFYVSGYISIQLIDIRKFFEKNDDSYKLSCLIEYLNNPVLTNKYNDLRKSWSTKFKNITNKKVSHISKEQDKLDSGVFAKELNLFLNQVSSFFTVTYDVMNITQSINYSNEKIIEEAEKTFIEFTSYL